MQDSRTRYSGAQPFSDDEISRKTFFGRERESLDLANKILANRLVVVYAKSGLGKTSLLNAGVAQLVRNEKCLPLIVRVNDVQRGPFNSIIDGIRTAAERQLVEYIPGNQASLWHFFKTAEFWQGDLLLTPVLILDQFEELFTIQSAGAQAAFLSDLGYLVRGVSPSTTPQAEVDLANTGDVHNELTDTPPDLRIVLSLREDYLGFLEDAADWIPQILDHRFRLTPLSIEAAKEALTRPAQVDDSILQTKPFAYAAEAVTTITDYLSGCDGHSATLNHKASRGRWKGLFHRSQQQTTHIVGYIEPFQLQLICQRIERIAAERQRSTDSPVIINTVDIGGAAALRAMLRDFYKQEIHALSSWRQRRAVHRLCEKYLISSEGRRLSIEEHEIQRQLKLSSEILAKLVDRRLLRSDQRADSTYYELSHDTLVEPVLATSRIKARFLGFLAVGIGAVVFLIFSAYTVLSIAMGLYSFFSKEVRPEERMVGGYIGIFGVLVMLPLTFVGIRLLRRGIQTFRRYRSRV